MPVAREPGQEAAARAVGSQRQAEDPARARAAITDHEFIPWRYNNGTVVCQFWDPEHPTRGICDRPEAEHARVAEEAAQADSWTRS